MVSAVVLAVGVVGLFFSVCGLPLGRDATSGMVAVAAGVSGAVTLVGVILFWNALTKERAAAPGGSRSLVWITLGVALLVLGAGPVGFVWTEASRQLDDSGPAKVERIEGAMKETMAAKRRKQVELARLEARQRELGLSEPAPEDRAYHMDLQRQIADDEKELGRLTEELGAAKAAPARLTAYLTATGILPWLASPSWSSVSSVWSRRGRRPPQR
jgi:hypothetical protein